MILIINNNKIKEEAIGMFRGYNLSLDTINISNSAISIWKYSMYNTQKENLRKKLKHFINPNGHINADQLQKEWFNEIDADIFISHSRKDKEKAIKLAAWLNDKFGLKAFIDSCVWGYADDLLREIDNDYSKHDQDSDAYDYQKRNQSTSHVHMMLATALTQMIDKTECIFFLNTPNAIPCKHQIVDKTYSPWIYHELKTTQLIRKTTPMRIRLVLEKNAQQRYSLNEAASLIVEYNADVSHLINIDELDLLEWERNQTNKKESRGIFTLNTLYELTVKGVKKDAK